MWVLLTSRRARTVCHRLQNRRPARSVPGHTFGDDVCEEKVLPARLQGSVLDLCIDSIFFYFSVTPNPTCLLMKVSWCACAGDPQGTRQGSSWVHVTPHRHKLAMQALGEGSSKAPKATATSSTGAAPRGLSPAATLLGQKRHPWAFT